MNAPFIRFPRQLEVDGSAETIRQVLLTHTAKLWPGGALDVPMLEVNDPLKSGICQAWQKNQLLFGLERIAQRLQRETHGIEHMRGHADTAQGERISRLLFFSNDGAERFYRHIEQLLQMHAPRVLGCGLDVDADTLGRLVAGKERRIKLVMVEHKDAVCDILRTLIAVYDRTEIGGSGG